MKKNKDKKENEEQLYDIDKKNFTENINIY